MSLRVWLPLDGSLENRGISNIDLSSFSVTYANYGKIGAKSLNSVLGWFSVPEMDYKKQMSFAYWVRLNSGTTTNWLDPFTWYSSDGTNNRVSRQEMYSYNSSTETMTTGVWYMTSATSDNSNSGHTGIKIGQWYHFSFTIDYEAGITQFFINGSLKHTTSNVFKDAFIRPGAFFRLRESNLDCQINDFRLYDHILSQKEVKEISQGLILHYKLNGWSGGVGENLAIGTNTADISTNAFFQSNQTGGITREIIYEDNIPCVKITRDNVTQSGWRYFRYGNFLKEKIKPSTYYTISFDIKATEDGNFTFGGLENTNATNNMMKTTSVIQGDVVKNTWSHIVLQGLTKDSFEISTQVVYMNISASLVGVGVSYLLKNMKLEEGLLDTRYIQNTDELNIDTTKIIDSSGYENNGTIIGAPTTVTDSKRYNISTSFDGVDDGVLIENLNISNLINTTITYSFWIKPTGENGARSVYFGSFSGTSWSIEKTASNLLRLYWNGSPDEVCSGATIVDGVWQHICIVKNGSNDIKVYIDGIQKWASTAAHNTLTFPTTFRISRDTRSGDNTPYNGEMSDFRIYVTALSAEDVATLYHTSAQVDDLGGFHGFEFKEENTLNLSDFSLTSSNWTSDGVTATYSEAEMGKMVKIVPSSGYKRIYHNVSNVWEQGKSYVVSMIAKADVEGAVLRASRSIADFALNFNLTTTWKKYYGIITSTTTNTGGTLSIDFQTSTNYYIADIKLEEANKNLVSISENGIIKENWLDENNFNNNAQISKEPSIIIANNFIEK